MLSRFRLFATPWTARAPLSTGLSRQEYWSGWPFSFPGNLPDPEIEPASPALQADSLCLSQQGSPNRLYIYKYLLRLRPPSHPPTYLLGIPRTPSPPAISPIPQIPMWYLLCKTQCWVLQTAVDKPEVGSAPHGPTSREGRQVNRKTARWSKSQPRLGACQRRPLSGRQRCEPGKKETQPGEDGK